MMSATLLIQEALVARLAGIDGLAGVYHDAPARAHFPYVIVNCSDERDWSCKGRQGREISLELELWDEQPSRLLTLEPEIERRLWPLDLDGSWRLSSLILTGKRRTREPGKPFSCRVEYRARLVEIAGEATS